MEKWEGGRMRGGRRREKEVRDERGREEGGRVEKMEKGGREGIREVREKGRKTAKRRGTEANLSESSFS